VPHIIEETSQANLSVEIIVDPTVSYASYQNHIPLLRSLRLVNEGNGVDYRNIEVVSGRSH
jgi:hypothetical protein